MAYRWRRMSGPLIRHWDADWNELHREQGRPEPWRRWARRIGRHALGLLRGRL
ncbi:hypothetical protein [Mycolicibacterium sp.]|uniref:hypothetical protein n=1 Tax=Mycolicibacterium sp. TaxID=2320850 RepID=UPI0037CB5373